MSTQTLTQAQAWLAKLKAADDNTEIWEAISEVKSNSINLSFERFAYAEFEDGSLLADSIDPDEHGLEEVYPSEAALLKDLSELDEAAMWMADETDPPYIELWGTLQTPEFGVDNLDLQYELTRCQRTDSSPALFGSTDYEEIKEDRVPVAYREELKKDVGRRVRVAAQVGAFREERTTRRMNTYGVEVEYLFGLKVMA